MSLLMLGLSFYGITRILRILLQSSIMPKLQSILNPEFDSWWKKYLHGYLLLLVGTCITLLLQSSSVITSFLVLIIRQQWGVVRHGTYPLKSKISNDPPPKISAGHGRYPTPSGPENFDPLVNFSAREARRKIFFGACFARTENFLTFFEKKTF